MSKADTMFKFLGYHKGKINDDKRVYFKGKRYYEVEFDCEKKEIVLYMPELTVELWKAIDEKVKEWGWLE